MDTPKQHRTLITALYINAALLVLVLLAVIFRPAGVMLESQSLAQQVPIAGGAGIFIMPAQLTSNSWGCYLLDVDAQTLATYQFETGKPDPGSKNLRFVAARNIRYDRRVGNWNTSPSPMDIKDLVEKEQLGSRVNPAATQPTSPEKP